MADNVTILDADEAEVVIGSDDCSGVQVQLVKLAQSADGSATPIAADGDGLEVQVTKGTVNAVPAAHSSRWQTQHSETEAQTNHSIQAAPGAGVSLYITDVVVSNGATAGEVKLLDGSGGTVLLHLFPAIGGGAALHFRTPLKLTANTALCLTSVTVTTHAVTVTGYSAA
jgi:hypothetical protein